MTNYAYFIEDAERNNLLFRLISDLEIEEDYVFCDTVDSKVELEKLLNIIDAGDRLVILSVIDLSTEDAKELLAILSDLQNKGIILCSVSEQYLNGCNYHTAMKGFLDINRYYVDRRRKQGYQEAHKMGIVGRKPKTEETDRAIRLYNTGAFTITEIEQLTKISKSTLYRALKDIDKQ